MKIQRATSRIKSDKTGGGLAVLIHESFTYSIWRDLIGEGVCITASGNNLVGGNISLKLFMAPLETIELLTFSYGVAEHHFPQL